MNVTDRLFYNKNPSHLHIRQNNDHNGKFYDPFSNKFKGIDPLNRISHFPKS